MGTCQTCENQQELQQQNSPNDSKPLKSVEIMAPLTVETDTIRDKRLMHTYENGAQYTGEWQEIIQIFGLVQIVMVMVYKSGQMVLNMKAIGRMIKLMEGVYFIIQMVIYVNIDDGEWDNDKANGYGVYSHTNGSKYEGCWKDDKQHGYGIETWIDGNRYEGNYKYGMKDGTGTYTWNDGKIYQGQWQQNKMTGYGICNWPDGRQYVGEWLDNQKHGQGKFVSPDGKQYEGDYYLDQKHGFGVFLWPDGRKYSGNWRKGKQHGKGKIVIDKIEKWGLWEDGKRLRWIDEDD